VLFVLKQRGVEAGEELARAGALHQGLEARS